jgi:hypothetical protein
VEQLFDQYETAEEGAKGGLIRQICTELAIHTLIEEEIFYPACRKAANDEEPLDEAQVEHDSAKMLIADLMANGGGDQYRDAKVKVLADQIKHHVGEEEAPATGIFAKARANGVNTDDLGERLKRRKQELQSRSGEVRPTRPVSLRGQFRFSTGQTKEEPMARQYSDYDRDERGRFTSDDDRDDRGRYRASGGGQSRYRDDDDGRGWHGDPQGHSEASRRGWEERRSFSRYDQDDDDRRGSHGPSRGYGRDDDDDRRGGYRGVARDEEGRFTSRGTGRDDYDDDRGRYSRGRGHGGWFGDPEGHAEASRRGWDEREGYSRSRYRDDDDDRRRSMSRGRDDDDDDRGRYSRGRGQGGWFGDSSGHAEAARRGWDDRR